MIHKIRISPEPNTTNCQFSESSSIACPCFSTLKNKVEDNDICENLGTNFRKLDT